MPATSNSIDTSNGDHGQGWQFLTKSRLVFPSCLTLIRSRLYACQAHRQSLHSMTSPKRSSKCHLSVYTSKMKIMAHTSDVYDAIPLEGPRTIRLVELHPAIDFNSPIECTISPASLSNCRHQYRALSYVWGVDKSSSKAIFNGRPITISANLDKALRRLRTNDLRCCNLMCSCQQAWYAGQTNHEYTYPPTRLWIDAVCIYPDRHRTKCCRNLRFEPQFCEGVGFVHLTCRIGKFTLRIFIMEIYQYIAFYLHLDHNSAFASPCPFLVSI